MERQRQLRHDWPALVRAQQVSGLGVVAFCRQEGLSTKSFYRHRQRSGQGLVAVREGFVQLRPVAAPTTPTGVVVVVGAWRVEVTTTFDPQTLRRVCACLIGDGACSA